MNISRQHECVLIRAASSANTKGIWVLSCILCLAAIGCSQGVDLAPVRGTVTFEEQPITCGTISFYPEEGGRPATGEIGSDGTYTLSTFRPGDGAIVGEYKVAIEAKKVDSNMPVPKSLKEEIANAGTEQIQSSITWLVPEKYSAVASSGLTASVSGGSNQIDFDLP